MRRASRSVLPQAERQNRDMIRFTVERGKGKGVITVMFTSDKAILAAAAATALPGTIETFHLCVLPEHCALVMCRS